MYRMIVEYGGKVQKKLLSRNSYIRVAEGNKCVERSRCCREILLASMPGKILWKVSS